MSKLYSFGLTRASNFEYSDESHDVKYLILIDKPQ